LLHDQFATLFYVTKKQQQSSEQIIDAVLDMPEGARIMVLAPLVESRKGEFQSVFEDVRKAGFVRVRVDGEIRDLGEDIERIRQKALRTGAVDAIAIDARYHGERSGGA